MRNPLRILWGALPLAFLIISLTSQACSSQKPKLEMPDTLNLGVFSPGRLSTANFPMHNTGIDPLKIKSLRSGCDCITIDSFTAVIPPGDSGRVRIRYQAKDSTYSDTKSLYMESNDPIKPTREIVLLLKVDPKAARHNKIAVVPFSNRTGNPAYAGLPLQLKAAIERLCQNDLNLEPVSPDSLVIEVKNDPNYTSTDSMPSVIRRAAARKGIATVIFGELHPADSNKVGAVLYVQDYMLQAPIGSKQMNLVPDSVVAVMTRETQKVLTNMDRIRQQEMLKQMQEKILKKNSKLLDNPAPDFSLAPVNGGEKLSLAKYKGKTVLLHFFSITCEHCEEEMGWLKGLGDKFGKDKVQVLGISVDQGVREKVQAFANEKKLPYPIVLADDFPSLLTSYYLDATPQTTVIDPKGNVAYNNIGFNGKINQSLEQLIDDYSHGRKPNFK